METCSLVFVVIELWNKSLKSYLECLVPRGCFSFLFLFKSAATTAPQKILAATGFLVGHKSEVVLHHYHSRAKTFSTRQIPC